MTLVEELQETVAMVLQVDPAEISPDASLTELEVDSLTQMELISLVEKRTGQVVPDEDLTHLDSIAAIVDYANSLAAA